MTNMSIFIQEIYGFVQTLSIFNPYIYDFYKKKLEDITLTEIADKDNPYIVHLQGDYFNTENLISEYPELENYDHENDPLKLNDNFVRIKIDDDININDTELVNTLDYDDVTKTVKLTKDTLNNSNLEKTRYLYYFNRQSFTELLTRNPDQADLIKSIFYPVNIIPFSIDSEYTTALENNKLVFSQEGKLLNVERFSLIGYSTKGYKQNSDEQFLEARELNSVVEAITSFLSLFRNRWDVPEYIEFEKYSHVVLWTMLWTILPMVVLKQRIENMHTSAVHTDLLWEYLRSKGIGDYRDILNPNQQLFLYKNIRYLLHHKGTNSTLKILAKFL